MGEGVALPGKYVGSSVGETVGALDGLNDGEGVGNPTLYVGDRVGERCLV